jgi:hypothetical protein
MRDRTVRGLFTLLALLGALALAAPPVDAAAVRTGIVGFNPTLLARQDDSPSATVPIGFTVNFFGVVRDTLFVNNNGNVTFDQALSTFTPFDLNTTQRQIIAPFFADVDTRNAASGQVQYGNGLVNGRLAFIVNWIGVGYFPSAADKLNSFQLVIIDRSDTGAGNFDFEFNYDQIQWETGNASGGTGGLGGSSARAGFSNGTGTQGTFFEIAGSAINGAFLDTNPTTGLRNNRQASEVLGRYLFQARGGGLAAAQNLNIVGMVNLGPLGILPTAPSESPVINGLASAVAYHSNAANLAQVLCGGSNGRTQVYRRSLFALSTICVSQGNSPGNGDSTNPSISHDGNTIVFQSNATDLVTGACNDGRMHIFLALIAGPGATLSCLTGGADGSSFNPSISANANFVVYETTATNQAAGCGGNQSNVVLHDLRNGQKGCVTPGANGPSFGAVVSDTQMVAFQTRATNQSPSPAPGPCANGFDAVMARQMPGGPTTCISAGGTPGVAANNASGQPDISDDGLVIVYASQATNIDLGSAGLPPCNNGQQEIYVHRNGVSQCFSRAPNGDPANGPSSDPVVSGNGLTIGFTTNATNILPAVQSFATTRSEGRQAGNSQVVRRSASVANAATQLMSGGANGMGNGNSTRASLDFGGSVAVFQTSATNLYSGDTNGVDDVALSNEQSPPPPGRVMILAPATGAVFSLTTPTPITFQWTPLGTSTYGFEFSCPNAQLNPNTAGPDPVNGFGSACGGGGFLVTGNQFSATLTADTVPPGTYNVRVIPLGIPGATFSDAIAITLGQVNTVGDPTPVITSPASGITAPVGSPIAFAWSAVIGAPQYLFTVTGPTAGSFPLAVTSFAGVVPPVPSGAYQITITALNAAGQPLGPPSAPVTVNIP